MYANLADWSLWTPARLSVIAWCLSFSQFLIATKTWPTWKDYSEMELSVEFDGEKTTKGQYATMFSKYSCGFFDDSTFYEAFVTAAYASGMSSVDSMVFSYPNG